MGAAAAQPLPVGPGGDQGPGANPYGEHLAGAGMNINKRLIGWMAGTACLASALVPSVAARPARAPDSSSVRFLLGLERLEDLGMPNSVLERMPLRGDAETFTGTVTFTDVAGDLDRDGNSDAFITTVDYEFTIDWGTADMFPSIEEKADSRVLAVSGPSGKLLWRKSWKDFVVPMAGRVGKNDRPGALALSGLASLVGPFEDRRLTIDALAGRNGKRLWRSTHRSVTTSAFPAWAGYDVPTAISLFDGMKGTSTDVLLGVAQVASTGAAFTSASQAVVIDGRTGEEVRHPSIYPGVNWTSDPMAVSDLDADGLDDYVVSLNDSPGLGGGQDAPGIDGVVHGLRSVDGATLWTETGFDLNLVGWAFPLDDAVGDRTRDIGLMTARPPKEGQVGAFYLGQIRWVTYLIDGDGMRRWRRWGAWPRSPGDLDGDGSLEVVTMDFVQSFGKGAVGIEHRAYGDGGAAVWRRSIVSRYEKGPCRFACSGSLGSSSSSAGDLDADGIPETYVRHEVEQDPGDDPTFTDIISGASGKRIRAGGEELQAPKISFGGKGTDLLEVSVNRNEATVQGRDGDSFRLLWETPIVLNGLRSGRRVISVAGARLDRDDCGDVLVSINVDRDALTIAISGGSGKVLWQRTSKRDVRLTQAGPSEDLNRAC